MAWLFLLFTFLLAAGLAAALARYLGGRRRGIALLLLAAWLLYATALGWSGTLASPSTAPPRVVLVLVPALLGTLFLAFARTGREFALAFPASLLVGAQSYRIVVELFIHEFGRTGMLPRMLTWEGANLDVLAGLTAPLVAWLLASGRLSPLLAIRLALGWNALGLLLLANIVARAVLTTPAFGVLLTEVPNRALGTFPFTYIPAFMAPLALFLHVLAIRALLAAGRTSPR